MAVFMDEIYRDWILPQLVKDILAGDEWISELSGEELMEIARKLPQNRARKQMAEKVFRGENVFPGEEEGLRATLEAEFLAVGAKQPIKILKDEFKENKIHARTNIVGKQKKLNLLVDKLVNFIRQLIATPQVRQDPELIRLAHEALVFGEVVDANKPITTPTDDNALLGAKYRAYDMAREIVHKSFEELSNYKNRKTNEVKAFRR